MLLLLGMLLASVFPKGWVKWGWREAEAPGSSNGPDCRIVKGVALGSGALSGGCGEWGAGWVGRETSGFISWLVGFATPPSGAPSALIPTLLEMVRSTDSSRFCATLS